MEGMDGSPEFEILGFGFLPLCIGYAVLVFFIPVFLFAIYYHVARIHGELKRLREAMTGEADVSRLKTFATKAGRSLGGLVSRRKSKPKKERPVKPGVYNIKT